MGKQLISMGLLRFFCVLLLATACAAELQLFGSSLGEERSNTDGPVELTADSKRLDANAEFLKRVSGEVEGFAAGLDQMEGSMSTVTDEMKKIQDSAAQGVQGKIHLSGVGLKSAAQVISEAETDEHDVDKVGQNVVKAMQAEAKALRRLGTVPMSQQSKRDASLTDEQKRLSTQSFRASATLDALENASQKMKAGLSKHGEYALSEKMKNQVESLENEKESGEVMQIEEGGSKFVKGIQEKLHNQADCDGGGKAKGSDCDGGDRR